MVRFKNRYILCEAGEFAFSHEKDAFRYIKKQVRENSGELLLSKISFSLQIKYFKFNKIVIRVPKEFSEELIGSLFSSSIKIKKISGTIRNIQSQLEKKLRIELKRGLSENEANEIAKINYS